MRRSVMAMTALAASVMLVVGCSSSTDGAKDAQNTTTSPSSTQDSAAPTNETDSVDDQGATTQSGADADSSGAADAPSDAAPEPEPEDEPYEDIPRDFEGAVEVPAPANSGELVVGYFTDWGIYDRGYYVKNIEDSGSADELTHILYAFGNVSRGKCQVGDPWADHDKTFEAEESVNGEADGKGDLSKTFGNFKQLRALKEMHPDLKVLWSFGGWTWSDGFAEAAKNPEAFAESCYNLLHDPAWDGLFDGIDIDWEYPNECGMTCDKESGFYGYSNVIKALRAQFGADEIVTSAIGAGLSKLDAADYAGAVPYLDFIMPMTYDYYGAWTPKGPTAAHSPLTTWEGETGEGFNAEATLEHMLELGIPADKTLLGVPFFGHGWMGVTDPEPGGDAIAPARGKYEMGTDDYKELIVDCPPTGKVAGTAYGFCDGEWWGYDTPETMRDKMQFVKDRGLAGTFFWELSGDTPEGDLIRAIGEGLR